MDVVWPCSGALRSVGCRRLTEVRNRLAPHTHTHLLAVVEEAYMASLLLLWTVHRIHRSLGHTVVLSRSTRRHGCDDGQSDGSGSVSRDNALRVCCCSCTLRLHWCGRRHVTLCNRWSCTVSLASLALRASRDGRLQQQRFKRHRHINTSCRRCHFTPTGACCHDNSILAVATLYVPRVHDVGYVYVDYCKRT